MYIKLGLEKRVDDQNTWLSVTCTMTLWSSCL